MLNHWRRWCRTEAVVCAARVEVVGVCCRAPAGPPGAEDGDEVPRFVVPRRGVFSWHLRRGSAPVGPGTLLWIAPGERSRFGHPAGGHESMMVSLSPQLWAEVSDRVGLSTRGVASTVVPLPAATSLHGEVLLRAAPAEDAAHQEELALLYVAELAAVLAAANDAATRPRHRAAGHARLARLAVAFVAAHFREPIPRLLDATAAAVRCSPFHLARVFRREVGSTVHAFRERLRLSEALHAVAGGVTSLTMLADRLGYASHGHLTNNFRQAYGMPPAVARNTFAGPAEELRRILEAHAVR